jgi:hypothetical protein
MFETTYQHINSYKMYHDMNGYDNIMIKLDPPFAAMKMAVYPILLYSIFDFCLRVLWRV